MIAVSSLNELKAHGISRVVLTCGVFDGIHRGHQELISTAVALAARHQATPVLFTFDPHPAVVLSPDRAPRQLITPIHRQALLHQSGIRATVAFPFDHTVAAIHAEAFLDDLFGEEGLTICGIVVGEHWRFGYQALGDLELLSRVGTGRGAEIVGVAELMDAGAPISSTRIRQAVSAGDLDTAAKLLGRPFSLMGKVKHGKGIGSSELHYPTANLAAVSDVFPPDGIYAARARLWDDPPHQCRSTHDGILYLGNSPTFVEDAPAKPFIEVHIYDFDRDIYGALLEVEFLGFIRGDEKFDSVDALCQQIAIDIEQAKALVATSHG